MSWAPDYVTSAQLKSYIKIQHDDDDAFIANWITAVSRNIDDFTGRQFGQVALAETRYYKPTWDRNECKTYLEIDDLQDITDLQIFDSNSTEILDYELEPSNAVLKGQVYTRVVIDSRYYHKMSVIGKWGWNTVPAAIPTGLYIQAHRIAKRRDSPFGIAGSPTDGSEIRLLAKLDPDFITTLKPYVRKWYVR